MHLPRKPATVFRARDGQTWRGLGASLMNQRLVLVLRLTCTRPGHHANYVLARTYICAAGLTTWGVGPDLYTPLHPWLRINGFTQCNLINTRQMLEHREGRA